MRHESEATPLDPVGLLIDSPVYTPFLPEIEGGPLVPEVYTRLAWVF